MKTWTVFLYYRPPEGVHGGMWLGYTSYATPDSKGYVGERKVEETTRARAIARAIREEKTHRKEAGLPWETKATAEY